MCLDESDNVWLVLHSGSRGVGNQLASEIGAALDMEDPDLMMSRVCRSFYEWAGQGTTKRSINCHHNFAQREVHDGREIWVTRKGAIQAREGMFGVIPGSMGTRSYIVSGLGNSLSYESCSHGAGRRMSRNKAKKEFTTDDLRAAMEGKVWNDRDAKALLDEIPGSYKDIGQVMADQEDLVKVEATLTQILNYKGT